MARGLAQKIPDGTYRYASSERFENTVKELADVYRSRRTSVIQTIFSGPSDAVRSFADAFKLGQEEEDDG